MIRRKRQNKAFSLIEIILVIVVIAILFVVLSSRVDNTNQSAKVAGVKTDFRAFYTALKSVGLEDQIYTLSEEEFEERLNGYLDHQLQFKDGISNAKDPWGKEYIYSVTTEGKTAYVMFASQGYNESEVHLTLDEVVEASSNLARIHLTVKQVGTTFLGVDTNDETDVDAVDSLKTNITNKLQFIEKEHILVTEEGIPATCTSAGLTHKTYCSECGDVLKEAKEIPALGHEYRVSSSTGATCTSDGSVVNTCKRCGDSFTTTISAKGHSEVTDSAVAPTCDRDGKSEGSHCAQCNIVIKAQSIIPATGHNMEAGEQTNPTCTTSGSNGGSKCTKCSYKIKAEIIPALGHSYTEEISKEASCTTEGRKTFTCIRCNNSYNEAIPKTDHTIVNDVEVPATCTTTGKKAGTHCTNCDYKTGGAPINSCGHVDSDSSGSCDRCGESCEVQTAEDTVDHYVSGVDMYSYNGIIASNIPEIEGYDYHYIFGSGTEEDPYMLFLTEDPLVVGASYPAESSMLMYEIVPGCQVWMPAIGVTQIYEWSRLLDSITETITADTLKYSNIAVKDINGEVIFNKKTTTLYEQNVSMKLYSEVLTGTVGSSVVPEVLDIAVFGAPEPKTLTIKSDGTSKLSYHYTYNDAIPGYKSMSVEFGKPYSAFDPDTGYMYYIFYENGGVGVGASLFELLGLDFFPIPIESSTPKLMRDSDGKTYLYVENEETGILEKGAVFSSDGKTLSSVDPGEPLNAQLEEDVYAKYSLQFGYEYISSLDDSSMEMSYIFYKDGSIDINIYLMGSSMATESMPAKTYRIAYISEEEQLLLSYNEEDDSYDEVGIVSADGTQIILDPDSDEHIVLTLSGNSSHIVSLEAGLYDSEDNLICNWAESGINNTCSNAATVINNKRTVTKVVLLTEITEIADGAFQDCTTLKDIILSDTVKTVGDAAFSGCLNLKDVTLSNNLKTIKSEAFMNCISLTHITIPESVTTLGGSVFTGCDHLTTVIFKNPLAWKVGASNLNYADLADVNIAAKYLSDEYSADSWTRQELDPGLYNASNNLLASWDELVNVYGVDIETDYTDGTVTTYSLANVIEDNPELGNGVSLIIGNDITYIGENAFNDTDLEVIILPNTVTALGDSAFDSSSIISLCIPNSIRKLCDVIIGYTSITGFAVPDSVQVIGVLGLAMNTNLKYIDVDARNTRYTDIDGVLYNKSRTTLITYPTARQEHSYRIIDGTKSIGIYAFCMIPNLQEVIIPDSVTNMTMSFLVPFSLNNVVFEDPNGWYIADDENGDIQISSIELSDEELAAHYLNSTYTYDSWIKDPSRFPEELIISKLIINESEYYTIHGVTWREWVYSRFNTNGYTVVDDRIMKGDNIYVYDLYSGRYADPDTIIDTSIEYTHEGDGAPV